MLNRKRVFLFYSILIIADISINAQIFTPGSTIQGNSNNNYVGIGITTPSAPLDLAITRVINGTYSHQYWSTGNADYLLKLNTIWADADGIYQSFVSRFNGVDYNVLSFRQGSVGIGTTSPSAQLHINSNGSAALKFSRTSTNDFGFEIGGDTFGLYDYSASAYGWIVAGGKVGIGTTAPQGILHIASSNPYLVFENTGANTNLKRWIIQDADDVTAGSADLQFKVATDALSTTQVMTLRRSGFVGIGTNAPNSPFSIVKDGTSQGSGAFYSIQKFTDSNQQKGLYLGYDANDTYNGVIASISGPIGFYTYNGSAWGERVAILEGGTVDIKSGVNNDYLKLEYPGTQDWKVRITNDNTSSFIIGNDLGGSFANKILTLTDGGNVGIGTTSPTDKFSVYNKFLVNHDGVIKWGASADYGLLSWDIGRAIVGGQSGEGLALYADGYEKVRILTNGNVGIGTTSPGNYKLNVSGRIRADEVVVNTTGADYVFDRDYKLLKILDVEKFIKDNGHLPDIASAPEIKENGLSVNEMQTKLLQKVEELTLYVIELKKENEDLRKDVNELKRK